jgi:hypothetical protein
MTITVAFGSWLASVLFALALGVAVLAVSRVLRQEADETPAREAVTRVPPPAWLYCVEGTPLDQRAGWFPLAPGGRSVISSVPARSGEGTTTIYLTAHDVRSEHALIRHDDASARYRLEAFQPGIRHNNETVSPGETVPLADGDILDFGAITRLRFSLSGPGADPDSNG